MGYFFKDVKTVKKEIVGFQCSKCKKFFNAETNMFEFQEVVQINIDAGYGSVFGDGNRYTATFCQHCFNDIAGQYLEPVDFGDNED